MSDEHKLDWKALFFKSILGDSLQSHLSEFAKLLSHWEASCDPKNMTRWQKQMQQLPNVDSAGLVVGDTVRLTAENLLPSHLLKKTEAVLKNFMPWRKGPFEFFSIHIDTEWRSDFKWQRVQKHMPDLQNASVLDVGCGSGYHLFRMHQAGASQVIGIDPTALFFYQFQCFKRYFPKLNIHFLPLAMEAMPATRHFDCVFSMGVLYHRQDPIGFLRELKAQIKPGGHLVLETLIVDGDINTVLVPKDRYAQMRNVWFIPSIEALSLWLERVGFTEIDCVDVDQTSISEQRATNWMDNHSLKDFLDPNDHSLTIEGYPSPKRAVIVAKIA